MSDLTTQLGSQRTQRPAESSSNTRVALVLVASRHEAHRVGEVLMGHEDRRRGVWGRSAESCDLQFLRVRPGRREQMGFPQSAGISRSQLSLANTASGRLSVENVGRRALLVDGKPTSQAVVKPGAIVELDSEMLFVASTYPSPWPAPRWTPLSHIYAREDADGMVGESPAIWTLRDNLAFVAATTGHALFLGESGSGKDVAAAAIARRSGGTFVSRNAATLPEGLVDAELFGSAKNYPSSGMPARPGLVGEADGGTLFLDEIAELPVPLQTRLLRVLDAGGEYHALGDARARRSAFRLVAATNQSASTLRGDLNARFEHRVAVPPLSERGADIILIAHALVRELAISQPSVFARFVDASGQPRLSFGLVRELLTDRSPGGVRGVRRRLLLSARASGEAGLLPTGTLASERNDSTESSTATAIDRPNQTGSSSGVWTPPAPETVQACLDKHQGVQGPVWRELGFRNRYQLQRFIKKHGLRTATAKE